MAGRMKKFKCGSCFSRFDGEGSLARNAYGFICPDCGSEDIQKDGYV